jgi:photosystem II stability/assembly factor-like uncharacterized protein
MHGDSHLSVPATQGKSQFLLFSFLCLVFIVFSSRAYSQVIPKTKGVKDTLTWQHAMSGPENNLNDVQFIDENTGWIVGEYGTLLKTINGGDKWDTVHLDQHKDDFLAVHFINQSIGWIGGANSILLKSTDGGSHWKKLPFPLGSTLITKVHFIDENYGIVINDGLIFKTADGGNSWVQVHLPETSRIYKDNIFLVDPDRWWISVGREVYTTENAGSTWVKKYTIPAIYPSNVRFVQAFDFDTCLAFYTEIPDEKSFIAKTTDGGKNWIVSRIQIEPDSSGFPFSSINFSDIQFTDPLNGFIIGLGIRKKGRNSDEIRMNSLLLRTQNGGQTWIRHYEDPYGYFYNSSMSFRDNTRGLIAGHKGVMYRFDTEGQGGYVYPERTYQNLYTLDGTQGIVTTAGGLLSNYQAIAREVVLTSTTSGSHWKKEESPSGFPLNQIKYKNADVGWKAGYKTLSITSDAGASWKNYYSLSSSKEYSINTITKAYIQSDSSGWLIAGAETFSQLSLYHFSGSTFTKVDHSTFRYIPETLRLLFYTSSMTDLHFVDDTIGFVTTGSGSLIKIQTQNPAWEMFKVYSVKPNTKLSRCFFVSGQTGWVVGEKGTIMKTTNGGESWIQQSVFPEVDWKGLYFLNERVGYLVGSKGHLIATKDGGSTWTRLRTNTRNTLNDITFIDGTGYIVGDAGTILVSNQLALPDCISPLCIPFSISKVKSF